LPRREKEEDEMALSTRRIFSVIAVAALMAAMMAIAASSAMALGNGKGKQATHNNPYADGYSGSDYTCVHVYKGETADGDEPPKSAAKGGDAGFDYNASHGPDCD
jgi:hypothetical protein